MAAFLDKKYKTVRFQYTDWRGKRHTVTPAAGTTIKQARDLFARIQGEHNEIKRGIRPPPKTSLRKPFLEALSEYLEWGNLKGGKGGRSWSAVHAKNTARYLAYWNEKLGARTLSDIENSISCVELILRDLKEKGVGQTFKSGKVFRHALSGKTLNGYLAALQSFCSWCLNRNYFERHPLLGIQRFDQSPIVKRRALTINEIRALIATAPRKRANLYELALYTGLRANELQCLVVADLDASNSRIVLRSEITKNKKEGLQYIPAEFAARLAADCKNRKRGDRLLLCNSLSNNASRMLEKDLNRAGIQKWVNGEKVDFHALRVAHVTLVLESGANAKEAQQIARHSNPELTMGIYARARDENLSMIVERIGGVVSRTEAKVCAHCGQVIK